MSEFTCSICGKEMKPFSRMRRTVDGNAICYECFRQLPFSVQKFVESFTSEEVRGIWNSLYVHASLDKYIANIFNSVFVCRDSLRVNSVFFKMEALRSVKLCYVPWHRISRSSVVVRPYVVLELKHPHVLLQEPIATLSAIQAKCVRRNGHVVCTCPDEEKIFSCINEALRVGDVNFTRVANLVKEMGYNDVRRKKLSESRF